MRQSLPLAFSSVSVQPLMTAAVSKRRPILCNQSINHTRLSDWYCNSFLFPLVLLCSLAAAVPTSNQSVNYLRLFYWLSSILLPFDANLSCLTYFFGMIWYSLHFFLTTLPFYCYLVCCSSLFSSCFLSFGLTIRVAYAAMLHITQSACCWWEGNVWMWTRKECMKEKRKGWTREREERKDEGKKEGFGCKREGFRKEKRKEKRKRGKTKGRRKDLYMKGRGMLDGKEDREERRK